MNTYPGQLIIHSVQRIMNMCECQATTPAWWLYHIKHLMRWDKLLILRAEGSNYFFLKLLKNVRLEISVQLVTGDNVRGQHNFFSSANLSSSFFFLAMFTLQDGFDFVLSYFDDPKTNFPSYCMNILTSTSKSMKYLLWIQWLECTLKCGSFGFESGAIQLKEKGILLLSIYLCCFIVELIKEFGGWNKTRCVVFDLKSFPATARLPFYWEVGVGTV